ncbi:Nucleolar 27S pre-rRNA proCES [Forsythia ovata]|uniref:Nucleolar 27S pre-rRNA proCES n=4 Tax=Forsythia ovata TaxID=205694 RepID=A0ABD1NV90_9LAMI
MADYNSTPEPASSNKMKKNNKKRKQRSPEINELEKEAQEFSGGPSTIPCIFERETIATNTEHENGSPWRNLQLILFLQNTNIDLLKKVDLVSSYVNSVTNETADDISQRPEMINTYRGDLLRVIHCIARDAISLANNVPSCCEVALSCEQLKFYDVVLNCVSLIFSSHGGVSNENLDLWIFVMNTVLELAIRLVTDKLDSCKAGNLFMQLSCCLLEPFAKFLRVHPTRKSGFRDFIDKLLEPLLHLLVVLHSDFCGRNFECRTNLSKLAEEVLSQGLFHPTHIDGFLCLQSTGRYKSSFVGTLSEEKSVNKSYHRHLFDKLEKIVANKNEFALGGLGELLHLFLNSVSKQKGTSVSRGGSRGLEISSTNHVLENFSQARMVFSENSPSSNGVDAEMRKSIFEFFVHIMEPLLTDINKYLHVDGELGSMSMDVPCMLRAINNLLACIVNEKVYVRTEDTSEGASSAFLRLLYDVFVSFSAKINHVKASSFGSEKSYHTEFLISTRKELIVAVHHLLDIEYKVVDDDLESLWTMIFSSVACSNSLIDVLDQSVLSSEILSLGCRLVDLYSELRQVNTSIFALCRAVRHFVSLLGDNEEHPTSRAYSSYPNSLSMILCSPEFRLSLSNAVGSIPEGQASGCIRQLSSDIMESLQWMKVDCQLAGGDELTKSSPRSCDLLHFKLQAELLGRALSEVYTIIVDSITVSSGNSYLVGVSLRNLIEIFRPSLSCLVTIQPNNIKEFSNLFTRRTSKKRDGCENVSMCWILVFYFRLYLSCRSLLRQAISYMPPDASKRMSGEMGDSFLSHTGRDWLETTGSVDEGYFSWIARPSASLLNVIHSILDVYLQGASVVCPPLVFVLNAMAFQRLTDLNRLIKSSEYMLQWNRARGQQKLKDDAQFSSYHKKIKRWKRCLSDFREEAAGLTKIMMGLLLSMAKVHMPAPSFNDGIHGDKWIQTLLKNDTLNFAIGSIDEKLLPSTLWWSFCRTVDIWCSHATKKDLKKFLTLLIQAYLSCVSDHAGDYRKCNIDMPGHLKKATAHHIALEFLSNTISYEQSFVRRYMASRYCRILQKSVSSIFASTEVDLSSSPDWVEVIRAVENSSNVQNGDLLWTERNRDPAEKGTNIEFAKCRSLLKLLNWMPKEYISSRSTSLYITCILNLERLLVGSLLGWHGLLCSSDAREILKLFVSCRRVLKNLIVASCEENMEGCQFSIASKLSESLSPLFWLSKSLSAVMGLQHAFPEDIAFEAKNAIFSLMDHTSYVFLTVSKDRYSVVSSTKLCTAKKSSDGGHEEYDEMEYNNLRLDPPENVDAWRSVVQVAETLKEQMQNSLATFNETYLDKKVGILAKFLELNKLASMLACFQGFLLGAASALGNIYASKNNVRTKLPTSNVEPIKKVKSCVDTCQNFIIFYLKALFVEDDQLSGILSNVQALNTLQCGGDLSGAREASYDVYDDVNDAPDEEEMHPTGKKTSSGTEKDVKNRDLKRKSHSAVTDLEAFFTKVQNEQLYLKKSLLLECFRGENIEAAFFLRQLLIASSAILRLNLQIDLTSSSWSLIPIFVGISQVLLLEFSSETGMPHPSSFVCLDGVVKFLEELGSNFPQFDPSLSRNLYVKLVDLHLRAIGKCISLQGKKAIIASQETGLHTKMLPNQMESSESSLSHGTCPLEEFKVKLRMSFRSYVRRPSELHFLSAIQAVERAIVGVQEGCLTNYEICLGSLDGGKVSSIVAAGIDCLELILEFVAGHNRLNMVKRHIQSLVACLFNVTLHLQGPKIFYGYVDSTKDYENPDSGSVILMSIEVLTRISGKKSLFHIDASHIAQSLRIPGALFQNFLHLPIFENAVDQKFSMELYNACCRLLCTVLKHHKRETQQCLALLEDSVSVLLQCLEIVNIDSVTRKDYFAWEVQEAVMCASSLRRVYEEVRQQKDVFGCSSFQFLSRYIWVYCGLGPSRNGIKREIDEALRPGVYALIDSCSTDDLQLLHTLFGEGPCRSTLASLQHDYKLHFQFEGKV